MIKKFFVLFIIVLISYSFLRGSEQHQIKVMTWNIEGYRKDGKPSKGDKYKDDIGQLKSVITVIKSVDADIVLLQEVLKDSDMGDDILRDNWNRMIGNCPQDIEWEKSLAEKYSYYVYGSKADVNGAWWGEAIFSKYPIVSHNSYVLYPYNETGSRELLEAVIKIGDNLVYAYTTHLEVGSKNKARLQQVYDILNVIGTNRNDNRYVVLTGDMNADYAEKSKIDQQILHRHFTDAAMVKFTGKNMRTCGPWRIDYIFLRNFEVKDTWIRKISRYQSDHKPLISIIKFK